MTRGEAPVQKAERNFRRRGPSRSRSCSVPTRNEFRPALAPNCSRHLPSWRQPVRLPPVKHIVIRKPQIWKSPASRVFF